MVVRPTVGARNENERGVKPGADLVYAYFDGALAEAPHNNLLATEVLGTEPFGIAYPTTTVHFFGMIDDVRVYHRAMDAAEIADLYNFAGQGPPGFLPPLSTPEPTKQVRHHYDALNRWVAKEEDLDGDWGTTADVHKTWYAYDGNQIVLTYEQQPGGLQQLTHRYFWGPGVDYLLADEQWEYNGSGHETLWALGDHLGTVRDLIDSGGTIRKHTAYDTFGNKSDEQYWDSSGNAVSAADPAAVDTLFGFTGRPLDESTGLQNNLNRWYDSKAGKWISEDPIGFAAGDLNLARYVGNSPSIFTDPRGAYPTGGIGLVWRYDQEGRVRAVWEESEEFQRGYHGSFGPSLIVTTGITIGGAAGAGAACGFVADQAIDTAFEQTTGLPSPFIISPSDLFKAGARRFASHKLAREVAPGDFVFRGPRDISDALDEVKRGGIVDAPRGGLLDDAARFAQRDYSEVFSAKGIKAYSELAGKRIITIDDLADAIRKGSIDPSKCAVDVIRRGDSTLILNTRTSEALRRAGIPRSRWNAVDRTGDSLFEELLNRQLLRNHLDNTGVPDPISQGLGL